MQADHRRSSIALSTALALGVTATVVRAEATLDGSMGTTGSFSGNFTIPETVGQTRGSNLFHSFSNFSVNAGESATFTGPDAINNVVSRVTGNSPSTFNGPLNSAIPSANFYFINPNGVLFKEGAQISVDGSFYATTSDFVRLGQDGVFYADPAAQSVLTSSPPSAFGFLDSNPAQISLTGTQLVKFFTLNQPDGATLSLVGKEFWLVSSKAARGSIDGRSWRDLSKRIPTGKIVASPEGTLISIDRRRFNILRSADNGETWNEAYTFEPETEHVHGAQGLRDVAFGYVTAKPLDR